MADLPDLELLIKVTNARAPSDLPLDRLGTAARVRDQLHDLAESLLDHYVEQARESGCSWSEIGEALGVSKQAVQQRHTSPQSVARRLLARVFEARRADRSGPFGGRFTDRARAVVVHAQQEARRLCHNYLGTEHLLLGLLLVEDGIAARALDSMGVSLSAVRDLVADIIGHGPRNPIGQIPFTPRAKKVMVLSLRESIQLKHRSLDTEHILLGLIREGEGVAMRILTRLGVVPAGLRQEVLRMVEAG